MVVVLAGGGFLASVYTAVGLTDMITVAEAIFTANTPIVTAIGHTDDLLIAN